MKTNLTNAQILRFMNIINDPKSFRNAVDMKFSSQELDFNLRVNIKTLNYKFEDFLTKEKELGKRFIDDGKTITEGTEEKVKDEFLSEFQTCRLELLNGQQDITFLPIKKEDFATIPLSMAERDLLYLMVEDMEV